MNATNDINSRMKFRPSMSAAQVEHVIALCKADFSDASIMVLRVLIPLKAKIDCEAIAPAYVTSAKMVGKPSQSMQVAIMDEIGDDDSVDKPLFERYRAGAVNLTNSELYLAKMYGYKRLLLSDEELAELRAEGTIE